MRTSALPFAFFLALLLAANAARADIPPLPVAGQEYAACLDKEIGGSCKTEDGVTGTCVVVQGGPYGRPWGRLLCLSAPEVERGRKEGWVVAREVAPSSVLLWTTLAAMGLVALAGAVRMRRRGRHGSIGPVAPVDYS
jgi:hypothetical protein